METWKGEMIGTEFDIMHAAGTTRFCVNRRHRTGGFWECSAVKGVSGTHHFIGGIEVFSTARIKAAISEPLVLCGENDPR